MNTTKLSIVIQFERKNDFSYDFNSNFNIHIISPTIDSFQGKCSTKNWLLDYIKMTTQSTRNISLSSWGSSVFRTEQTATHLNCANLCAFWTEGSCNAYKYLGQDGGCQLGFVSWLEDIEAGVRIMLEESLLDSLPLICAGGQHCCSRERWSEHHNI